ncbi:ferrochelatase [Leptospira idonii]|uniref:Ferrochelatase n=1 Tax=Leptospira idonii TaxID=1193500 RepID=A0A4R9M1H3_9LEPT|nr:ferrochelatase [Leptospira idonii]TGN20560.1 ferrochelatase [Leptospira idonii]
MSLFEESSKITLINLGGPRSPEEVEPFLKDLFLDPYVFDLPLWEPIRKRLAVWIAEKRAPRVAGTYRSMGFGGGSPLVSETEKQMLALVSSLEKKSKRKWNGRVLMTCGFPNLRDVLSQNDKPSSNNFFLPLYPQYSRSTVLSTAKKIESLTGELPFGKPGWVSSFSSDKRFLDASASLISDFFQGNLDAKDFLHLDTKNLPKNWNQIDLVFSAHGIPMRLVRKGDSYVREIEATVEGIVNRLRQKGFSGETHISYQSRVGPAKWTEPNTKEVLKRLGSSGKDIAVYPVSFVSDHLETLEEIGVELKDLALQSGANSYMRIPAFGTYPLFIDFLADLILETQSRFD